MLKINSATAPWVLASIAAIAILVGLKTGFIISSAATSDEQMAKLDQAIAAAIRKAEAGDVDGARQSIPSWSELNVEYMRALYRETREISSSPVWPDCSIGGRGIGDHLGQAKRAVAAWRIESFGNDPQTLADAKAVAVAQVRILGEIAANYARQCALRKGDYSAPGHPWTDFLTQISSYPGLQADIYLGKIADGEVESLRRQNSSEAN